MVAVLLTLTLGGRAQTAPAKLEDPAPIYRWLDACHFDFVDKPFVEITDRSANVPKIGYGFLCRPGTNFEVMTVGLRLVRLGKTATYQTADLKRWLDRSEFPPEGTPEAPYPWNLINGYADGLYFCMSSWLANKSGLSSTALRLFSKVEESGLGYAGEREYVTAPSRLAWIQATVPARYSANIVRDFANGQIARSVVANEASDFLAKFPGSSESEFAAEAQKAAETEAPDLTVVPPATLSQWPEKEYVAYHVKRLSEIRESAYMSPGAYVFAFDPHYSALVREAFAAVPALITALDDRRFTRAGVGQAIDPPPNSLFRVRDIASLILGEISGESGAISVSRPSENEAATSKAAFKEWWGEVQRMGEVPWLKQAILRGQGNVGAFVERLATLDPSATWPILRDGYPHAPDSWARGRLLQLAMRVGGQAAVDFVRREMISGVDRETRVAAAVLLLPKEPQTVVSAMQAEFDRSNVDSTIADAPLLEILLGFGTAPVIDHFRDRLPKLTAGQRSDMVTSLSVDSSHGVPFVGNATPVFSPAELAERRRAVENLLGVELKDTDRLVGASIGLGNRQFRDPRVCELASYELADLIGPPYRSYDTKSNLESDELCAANLRVWRIRRGMNVSPAMN